MSWAEALGALPPVAERRTAAGHVADTLRAAIRTGAIGDGAELNQVALAEHFGVSRVPVRCGPSKPKAGSPHARTGGRSSRR
jgi:hypothetical protein